MWDEISVRGKFITNENVISIPAPGPLFINARTRCLTYIPSDLKLVLAATCDEAMFYYDGEYIREATTHLCISSPGIQRYAEVTNADNGFRDCIEILTFWNFYCIYIYTKLERRMLEYWYTQTVSVLCCTFTKHSTNLHVYVLNVYTKILSERWRFH